MDDPTPEDPRPDEPRPDDSPPDDSAASPLPDAQQAADDFDLAGLDCRSRAWADISTSALTHNLGVIRSRIPSDMKVLAVLKADAYGHGAIGVARHLERVGIDMIGVGDSSEALELRDAAVGSPLLILGAIVPGEMEAVVRNDIATVIHSKERAAMLADVARALGLRARVHLKIDTGMGRLGVTPQIARTLARSIASNPHLSFEGLCTHYGSAASPVPFHTADQLTTFVRLHEEIRADGIALPLVHASNSAAVFSTLRTHFTMVRTGLALYGMDPGNLPVGASPLQPVLSLRTQIVYMKDVVAETPVGYNRTYVTPRPTRLAVIAAGYSDGLPYALSNRSYVLIRGERAPIVGSVSMDYTTVDVTEIEGTTVGDEVTIIGESGKRRIRTEDLARTIGTIPYEITTRLGRRVARRFI
ncbi:MAG: alanine racemase [Planctomycetes bacterium]|nr:alanine racemase [Planctomycetota bacterium]